MGRGMMAMEFITKEKTRLLTFQNRKKSIFKKAYELSVLCDVDVCVIINGFLISNRRNRQSEIWPENPDEVRRIIAKYEAAIQNSRRQTKSSLSNSFPEKKEITSETMPFPVWDTRLDSLSTEQSFELLEDLDKKLQMVDKRIDELQTRANVHFPITDSSSGGEEHTMNDGCFGFTSPPPDDFFDDCEMNFLNDFPLNDGKLLDFPIDPMQENYIIFPDPYIDLPPLEHCSAESAFPSESCWLPPLPPSPTPSVPFLGQPGMTWSGFFDGGGDYQMNGKEEERFSTVEDIGNFMLS